MPKIARKLVKQMLTPGINEKAKMDHGKARSISVKYKINSVRREEKYMGD